MRTKEFLNKLEHQRISDAIAAAEGKTSGEIRVYIQRGEIPGDALPIAQQKFDELGMTKTAERNGVLIFVAPRPQKFAVVGDEGIHQKCGADFWQQLADSMAQHFREQNFTDGIVDGITRAGELLAQHFPRQESDRNELPNTVMEE
jgi:uncharacterized membrane protein